MDRENYVKLSEISELITKGTTPTTIGFSFVNDGINFLKIECFDDNGDFLYNKISFITKECHDKMKRSQLKDGDILFSIAGAIGRVAIVTEDMLPANTNQALAIIRITNKEIYLQYVKLILGSPIVVDQFEKKKQGVAQLNLSLKDINELKIPLPEKNEQIKICKLFEKIKYAIKDRYDQIHLYDELVKSRFIELFKDDLNGEKHKLSDYTEVITKGTTPTTLGFNFVDEGINFVKIECITEDYKFIKDKMLHITDECNQKLKRSILKENDILFSIAGAIGRTAIVSNDILPANTNQALAIIRLKEDSPLDIKFLNEMLNSDLIKQQSGKKVNAVAQANISLTDIGNFEIIVPSKEKQKEYSEFVEKVDKSKFEIQQSLDKYQQLFDSLMQEYFG